MRTFTLNVGSTFTLYPLTVFDLMNFILSSLDTQNKQKDVT